MDDKNYKKQVIKLLNIAGICPNGSQPWDINIHNPNFYSRVLKEGSLGLGESYMDGWWDCQNLDQFFARIVEANIEEQVKANLWFSIKLLFFRFLNRQTKRKAIDVADTHYNLGNDLFKIMLDDRMNYTCGYWKNANNLNEAQINKLELTCQKLLLKPGMHLLDIGCGFGALAFYAAKNYGVNVVGITISKEQYDYATQQCEGLPIKIYLQDYRDLNGSFDRIASLGMFEHVGPLNYKQYMQIAHDCLNEDGLFLLHTIGSNQSNIQADEWINKYIFPNSVLPSITQIAESFTSLFVMEDWHNFGTDYEKTLLAWQHNFQQGWDQLKDHYDERFYRMWNYYLGSCAAFFRVRRTQLWQIVLSKHGIKGGYQAPR